MFAWIKFVLISHWLAFTLLATTWLFGYLVPGHAGTPGVALYYVLHAFAGCALFGVAFFHLHPGKEGISPHRLSVDPHELTLVIHRVFYYLIALAPPTGVLVFFVPDSTLHWSDGSFLRSHVYNDNFAHMLHGLLFYLVIALGLFNFLFVMAKRRNALRQQG